MASTGRPKPRRRPAAFAGAGFDATMRAVFVGVLALVLLIPLGMIEGLVQERESRKAEVESGIADQWGGRQSVLGPILAVPYRYVTEAAPAGEAGGSEAPRTALSTLYFLPKHLDVKADLKTERRAKSIYDVLVYGGRIALTGDFAGLAAARADIEPDRIAWNSARLLVGVTDITGLRSLSVTVADHAPLGDDTAQRNTGISNTLSVPAPLDGVDRSKPVSFAVSLDLRGSTSLQVAPIGDATTVSLSADWPHPDFSGRFLPDSREISDAGFSGKWVLGALSREVPSSWRVGEINPETLWNTTVGATLVEPGDVHQQTDRILKYGLLVIALTFTTIFVNGLFGGRKVHPVQYLMVGAALCLFYLLLLSLSEHIGFLPAYVVASVADIAVIAWYAWRTMSRRLGYITAGLLAAVQAYVYDLLQMDDYALLAGTLALFAVLLATMIATRNIDWYRIGRTQGAA
jgi:inner membrane protein